MFKKHCNYDQVKLHQNILADFIHSLYDQFHNVFSVFFLCVTQDYHIRTSNLFLKKIIMLELKLQSDKQRFTLRIYSLPSLPMTPSNEQISKPPNESETSSIHFLYRSLNGICSNNDEPTLAFQFPETDFRLKKNC